MDDLKTFCLLEGFGKHEIGGLRRGPTMKIDPSSRRISDASLTNEDDMTSVKRLNKASFVISPKNSQAMQTDVLIPEEVSECISEDD